MYRNYNTIQSSVLSTIRKQTKFSSSVLSTIRKQSKFSSSTLSTIRKQSNFSSSVLSTIRKQTKLQTCNRTTISMYRCISSTFGTNSLHIRRVFYSTKKNKVWNRPIQSLHRTFSTNESSEAIKDAPSDDTNLHTSRILGQLPPFWGIHDDTILHSTLPPQRISDREVVFFGGTEENFLWRASRAFERVTGALFAPTHPSVDNISTSDDIAAAVAEGKLPPTDELSSSDTMTNNSNTTTTDINASFSDDVTPEDVLEDMMHDGILVRAKAFRKSGANTSMQLKVKEAKLLDVSFFFDLTKTDEDAVTQQVPSFRRRSSAAAAAVPIAFDAYHNVYANPQGWMTGFDILGVALSKWRMPTIFDISSEAFARVKIEFTCEEHVGIHSIARQFDHIASDKNPKSPDHQKNIDEQMNDDHQKNIDAETSQDHQKNIDASQHLDQSETTKTTKHVVTFELGMTPLNSDETIQVRQVELENGDSLGPIMFSEQDESDTENAETREETTKDEENTSTTSKPLEKDSTVNETVGKDSTVNETVGKDSTVNETVEKDSTVNETVGKDSTVNQQKNAPKQAAEQESTVNQPKNEEMTEKEQIVSKQPDQKSSIHDDTIDDTMDDRTNIDETANDTQDASKNQMSSRTVNMLYTQDGNSLVHSFNDALWVQREGWRIIDIDGHQPGTTSFFAYVRRALELSKDGKLIIMRSNDGSVNTQETYGGNHQSMTTNENPSQENDSEKSEETSSKTTINGWRRRR